MAPPADSAYVLLIPAAFHLGKTIMRALCIPRSLYFVAALIGSPLTAQEPLRVRVDSVFARWNSPESPGCALGVYRGGQMAYARGYGMANLELGVPITSRTVFDIGSTAKQFTAASIVLLSQRGALSLDDDVRKWIPELPSYGKTITIRHLLHHTSGLRDYIGLMALGGHDIDDVTSEEDALGAIARQKALNFQPGDEHLYSNSGFFLASVIVKRAAGASLREFAAKEIFTPLGMGQTLFRDDHTEMVPHRASAYSRDDAGGYRIDMSNWEQLGDGGVFTTVEDLLRWDENFYHPRVGGQPLLDTLQTVGRLNNGDTLDYALGLFAQRRRGLRLVSHGGSWGGYRAELLRAPSEHFSVAVLCNLGDTDPSELARRVLDIYLAGQLQPLASPAATRSGAESARPVRVDAVQLRRWAGTYRNPRTGSVRVFEVDSGHLVLQAFGGRWQLPPSGPAEFSLADSVTGTALTYRFETPAAGARGRVEQVAAHGSAWFEALALVTPSPAELDAYDGSYRSEELNATFRVTVADGKLRLHDPSGDPDPLRPLERDEFTGGGVTVRFQRDPGGQVQGFLLGLGRVRDLVFTRVP